MGSIIASDAVLIVQLVEAFGAGTAAILSPVSNIGYLGQDINIPVGEAAAAMMGRQDKMSMAENLRKHLQDIQVRNPRDGGWVEAGVWWRVADDLPVDGAPICLSTCQFSVSHSCFLSLLCMCVL